MNKVDLSYKGADICFCETENARTPVIVGKDHNGCPPDLSVYKIHGIQI